MFNHFRTLYFFISIFSLAQCVAFQVAANPLVDCEESLNLDQRQADNSIQTYVLLALPKGQFGKELDKYWKKVRHDRDLNHKAIRNYPPHCSLTGFFDKPLSDEFDLLYAIQGALDAVKNLRPIVKVIPPLVQGSALDYIELDSSFFFHFTEEFLSLADVPSSKMKGIKLPYHITLRNREFYVKSKTTRIQKLESQINLKAKASWTICLFRKKGEKVEQVGNAFDFQ